jgi:hypothetical protein
VDRLCNIQAAGTWEGTGAVESSKNWGLPEGTMGTRPGKHTKNDGKSPFLIGRSTISMAIFNSYVNLPRGYL